MAIAPSDYAALVRAAGAVYLPLKIFHRQARTWLFRFMNVNHSLATWRGQVRARPDAGGAALASFTFSATMDGADTVLAVTLSPAANSALPAPAEPGTAGVYYYDIAITPSGPGGVEQTIFAGELYRVGSNLI